MARIKHYGHLSIKFLDVMFGAVMALGFTEWFKVPEHTSQSLLTPTVELGMFLFSYLILIDMWIKYDPTMRRFPTKHPHLLIIDLFMVFTMFFLVHNSIFNNRNFLGTIVVLRAVGSLWSQRTMMEYKLAKKHLEYFLRQRNAAVAEMFAFLLLFVVADKLPSVNALLASMVVLWAGFRALDMVMEKDILKVDD